MSFTSFEQPEIIINASRNSFASGYIFKSQCQTLNDTIKNTVTSHTPQEEFIKELVLKDLTETERSVFYMMLGDDIILHSADKTIANQKTSIFKKLGVKNINEVRHVFKEW